MTKSKAVVDHSAVSRTKPLNEGAAKIVEHFSRPPNGSLLEKVEDRKKFLPPRIMIYGSEGVGKSTYGSKAPKPIFIQTEDGLDEIDCKRFPLAMSIQDVYAALDELLTCSHEYETVVVDSLDWLERLILRDVCAEHQVTSIEEIGYQKGYIFALDRWTKVIASLQALRTSKNMACILTAHAKVEKFEDPESVAYDRYAPRLNKHATALVTEWVDAILFATRRFRTDKQEQGFNRERAVAVPIGADGGERIVRTVGSPACVAKNRYSLPAELPLSWSAVLEQIVKNWKKGE